MKTSIGKTPKKMSYSQYKFTIIADHLCYMYRTITRIGERYRKLYNRFLL